MEEIGVLFGKTITDIETSIDEIAFKCSDGSLYKLTHYQSCCESVVVDDIVGDISDLINTPILRAEESISGENPEGVEVPEHQDSFTWTFYHISTIKGHVTIRWYGESNGYYSESVDFVRVK